MPPKAYDSITICIMLRVNVGNRFAWEFHKMTFCAKLILIKCLRYVKEHSMRRLAALILCLVVLSLTLERPSHAQATLGTQDDLNVSDAEIAAAQKALGDSSVGILAC